MKEVADVCLDSVRGELRRRVLPRSIGRFEQLGAKTPQPTPIGPKVTLVHTSTINIDSDFGIFTHDKRVQLRHKLSNSLLVIDHHPEP